MIKSYRDLEIYKLSYDLAVKVHIMSLKLPQYEIYEEGSQVRKSSKGITSCIAEGYGRKKYKAEFRKFPALRGRDFPEKYYSLIGYPLTPP